MAYAYTIYSAGSSQTDYTISFPYIKEAHVKVYVNYVDTSFTFHNATTARLASAPASGTRVEVRRVTPPAAVLVDYADGSTLTASDLDTSNLQHLYIAQELDDTLKQGISISSSTGLPTLGSQKLTNVADPTAAQDAATKNYVDTTTQPVDAELTELATM
ncbi:phage tail fiber protein, partial [Acinetobacter sp.]|uniref:phage tail fiber domain-containing protein n=1 Tax=Acinetobacter sp. TaxID=472 RepID=UPI000C09930A